MGDTSRLARIFVELADTLVEEFDMAAFLTVLTERCRELLPIDVAGLMLTDQQGDMQVFACTPERARRTVSAELVTGIGPGHECFATGVAITNVGVAEAKGRWPAADVDAFASTHAFPMRLRGQALGALVLYSSVERLGDESLTVAQSMADVATIGLLHERSIFDAQLLSGQLQAALHSRVLVEQAKGMLAARADISVSAAFSRMRKHARSHHLTMTAVASAVINGAIDERILSEA